MNNKLAKIALASAAAIVAAAASAQHIKVFDGQSGQLAVPAGHNALIAFPGFKGGVRVAVGDIDGDGAHTLERAAATGRGGTFTLTFQGQTTAARGNNLKQLGLGAFSGDQVRISIMKKMADGSFKEVATYQLIGLKGTPAKPKPKPKPKPSGDPQPVDSFSLNFEKIKVTTYIGSANGGVWKTTNGGHTMIGMLLPAIQKVRG